MTVPTNIQPAFPHEFKYGDGTAQRTEGMTLRDYFAIHGTQPGMDEIVKSAGFGIDRTSRVYMNEGDKTGVHFSEWWSGLSIERQCQLCAMVRYAQADAMLKERSK